MNGEANFSPLQIEWLRSVEPAQTASILELPETMVRSLYPELFEYGPNHVQLFRTRSILLKAIQEFEPNVMSMIVSLASKADFLHRTHILSIMHELDVAAAVTINRCYSMAGEDITQMRLSKKFIVENEVFSFYSTSLIAVAGQNLLTGFDAPETSAAWAEREKLVLDLVNSI